MKKLILVFCVLSFACVSYAEVVPTEFCGFRLGQKVPDGVNPTSKTEMYYGYNLSAKETILKFNQYQFHASLITKTVTNAGAGYTTTSKSDADQLFVDACRWLERKYPGKKCEDFNIPNRTIRVMRFGEDAGGHYLIEKSAPVQGMYLVIISLYNDQLSQLEDREAKEFASGNMAGQSAPHQFSVKQANNNLNQGKPIQPMFTNSMARVSAQQSTVRSAFDETKETMGAIRGVIERYQQQTQSRVAPKDINALKTIAKGRIRTWKDGWGNVFLYECDGDRWVLRSAGADKIFDTEDDLIFICEDGMNVTTVGYPTGNGKQLDSEVVNWNSALREKADEDIGGRPDGWTKIEIPGFVTVDIPPTIELQKGAYKSFKETVAKVSLNLDLRDQALTFQQAGLNDLEEGSTRRYARIIFKSFYDKKSDFDLLDEDMTPEVLKLIEEDEYAKLNKSLEQMKRSGLAASKIIKWYPVQKIWLGGLLGYRTAYLRQLKSNPPVFVEEYKLVCGRYLHSITFSYRQSEESFWKKDYAEIKRRIMFNKKK